MKGSCTYPLGPIFTDPYPYFSRMRSKGSRFTLGVWGLRACSLDVAFTVATVRNRSQPFATVRNRPQPSATVRAIPVWPCLWEVLQRWSFLEVSDVSLLRFAWQAWHFVAGAILLRRFQKMCCSFRGRRSTLDVSIVIFRGRRSTLDVSCCVFFANRIGRAASRVYGGSWKTSPIRMCPSRLSRRFAWQAWYFVTFQPV